MSKNILDILKKVIGIFGLISFLLGFISIVLPALLGDGYDLTVKTIFTATTYTVACFIAAIIIILVTLQKKENSISNEQDKQNLTDILGELDIPIAVCKSDESVFWTNKAFREVSGITFEEAKKMNLKSFTQLVSDALVNRTEGIPHKLGGKEHIMKGFYVNSGKRNLSTPGDDKKKLVLVWQDISGILSLQNKLSSEKTLIANILIDNIDELVQFTGTSAQSITNSVEKKLSVWASSVGGVLKEYQRSRYIFMFEKKHLDTFAENKFEILEEIRKIKFGQSRIPVTVSMGISDPDEETLDKKMKSASEYLEAALQRGGDQVAVKINNAVKFYGGVTKSVQSVNKTRAKIMASRVMAHIREASNILVMGHKNADYDSFGACIAAAKIARCVNPNTRIIINEKDPNIRKCLAKAKTMPEYSNIFINKEDAHNRINSETLLLIVDVNNVFCFESKEVYEDTKKVIFIDHHRLDRKFEPGFEPLLSFIDTSVSSTCEIFSEFLEELLPEDELTDEEADIIYAGIALDSKKFTVSAGPKTFAAAMYLRKCGADPMRVNKDLFATEVNELVMLSGFQTEIQTYCDIVVISLNRRTDLTIEDDKYAAMAADRLLTLEGVHASFTVCMIDGRVRIKARSDGKLNVQLILEKLKGGGHFDQAATVLSDTTLENACIALKAAIDSEINHFDTGSSGTDTSGITD